MMMEYVSEFQVIRLPRVNKVHLKARLLFCFGSKVKDLLIDPMALLTRTLTCGGLDHLSGVHMCLVPLNE